MTRKAKRSESGSYYGERREGRKKLIDFSLGLSEKQKKEKRTSAVPNVCGYNV